MAQSSDFFASELPAASLLTVEEVAAALRVSKMTVYRMVERGEIPSVRIGRSFRIPREPFQQWWAERLGETP